MQTQIEKNGNFRNQSTEFISMKKKTATDVTCRGRMPGTSKPCENIMYQSDGIYLYIRGLILNPEMKRQRIVCDRCGFVMKWERKQNPGT